MYFSIEPYHSVLARFEASLHDPQFFSLLVGEEGGGKTALLHQLQNRFEDNGFRTGFFPVCPDSPEELRKLVGEFFELPSSYNFSRRLQEQLIHENESCKGVVLIFDDCQFMSDKTLLEMCRLTDIQIDDSRMMNIIMCGTPAMARHIANSKQLQPLRQRISYTVSLGLPNKKALAEFVSQYYQSIDQPGVQFDPAALSMLYKATGGRPGTVLNVCKLIAESRADSTELDSIGRLEVLAALKHPSANTGDGGRTYYFSYNGIAVAAPVFAVLALLVFGLAYQNLREAPSTPVVSEVAASPASTAVAPPTIVPLIVESSTVEPSTVETARIEPTITEPEIVAAPEVTPAIEPESTAEIPADSNIASAVESTVLTPVPLPEVEVVVPDVTPATEPVAIAETVTGTEVAPEQAVEAWVSAWEARDMDGYFASYHGNFVPRNHPTVDAWRQDRRRSITTKAWIEIDITDMEVLTTSDSYTELQFWLKYSSPDYSDDTLKKLNLVREDSQWLIMSEINLEVR
ncbi:MAG: AAA family ATPase [Gammaproteobacteria bacterium]|nr:AAA family ATPase [Gammaproteobacteria bacterium]